MVVFGASAEFVARPWREADRSPLFEFAMPFPRSSSASSRRVWYAFSIEMESFLLKAEYFLGAGGLESSFSFSVLLLRNCGFRFGTYSTAG